MFCSVIYDLRLTYIWSGSLIKGSLNSQWQFCVNSSIWNTEIDSWNCYKIRFIGIYFLENAYEIGKFNFSVEIKILLSTGFEIVKLNWEFFWRNFLGEIKLFLCSGFGNRIWRQGPSKNYVTQGYGSSKF